MCTVDCDQVKMFYDGPSYQLIVTVLGAAELPSRDSGHLRNTYCRLHLLPEHMWVDRVELF